MYFCTSARTLSDLRELADVVEGRRRCRAPTWPTFSSLSVMSATRYGRLSPCTITCEMYGVALSAFSRFCGAMFLPPALTMMSFLRSVIRSDAVVDDADVAGVEPALGVDGLARRLGLAVVLLHHRAAADEDLAVLGDLDLEPGTGAPTEPKAYFSGRLTQLPAVVSVRPVALEDEDAGGVEELGDLARQRRAARDEEADAPAENRLDFAEHQSRCDRDS